MECIENTVIEERKRRTHEASSSVSVRGMPSGAETATSLPLDESPGKGRARATPERRARATKFLMQTIARERGD
jgi:hypothetical protein